MGKRKSQPKHISLNDSIALSFELGKDNDNLIYYNNNNEPPRKKKKLDLLSSSSLNIENNYTILRSFNIICNPITNRLYEKLIQTKNYNIKYYLQSTNTPDNPLFSFSLIDKISNNILLESNITKDNIIDNDNNNSKLSSAIIYSIAYIMIKSNPILYLNFNIIESCLHEQSIFQIDICLYDNSFIYNKSLINERENSNSKHIKNIISWIYPDLILYNSNDDKDELEFNPLLLYNGIQPSGNEPLLENIPKDLNITLRNYQQQAIYWMLQRELNPPLQLHNPLWKPIKYGSNIFYYNILNGLFSKSKQYITYSVKGGILADEMGLGKSIEVLSCILLNTNTNINEQKQNYYKQLNDYIEKSQNIIQNNNNNIKCYCRNNNNIITNNDIIQCKLCNTFQHLTCIGYTNKNNIPNIYLCPDCNSKYKNKIPSNTTLIICPSAILQQWRHEIVHRTSLTKFKILIYDGITDINRENQLSNKKINKSRIVLGNQLSEYDIVLTTFDILRGDLNHSNIINSSNTLKRGNRTQKYRSIPTPLKNIKWWRICIDEAQMVGNSTAKAANMALQLESEYHWCISGTPIQRKGLEDLRGLFLFLQIPLLNDTYYFKNIIQIPMEYSKYREKTLERLIYLTKPIMWRSSKENVKNELFIPKQSEKIHMLRFTPVEAHYYKKQHQACYDATSEVLIRSQEQTLTTKQMSSLLNSLLRLRQVCCHPQIGNHSSGIQIQRTPLTMEQLLDQLILKAKIECEETQRQWIVAGCGIAALKLIQAQQYDSYEYVIEASKLYRDMIHIINENKLYFEIDSIQLLHIYHNLGITIGVIDDTLNKYKHKVNESLGSAIIDNNILDIINNLRKTYTEKNTQKLLSAKYDYNEINTNIISLINSHTIDNEYDINKGWWEYLFINPIIIKKGNEIISKIKDTLKDINGATPNYLSHPQCLLTKFYSIKQLQITINAELHILHNLHSIILEKLKEHEPSSNQNILINQVQKIIGCTCRSSGGLNNSNILCFSCDTFKSLVKFENALYFDSNLSLSNTNNTNNDKFARSKHDSDLIILLQSLVGIIPNILPVPNQRIFVPQIQKDIDIISLMKKQVKKMRLLWEAQRNYFLSIDELQQATTRIRLRYKNEIVLENEKHYKIQEYEIIPLLQKYKGQQQTSWHILSQKKGQLKYLNNLERKQKHKDTDNTLNISSKEECVICREIMGEQVVILACGHEFCGNCITTLIVRSFGTIKCPTCRTRMNSDEIAYISDKPIESITEISSNNQNITEISSNNTINNDITIVGSWGTKIEGIIRELLRIKVYNPTAKSIIFSQWTEVLEILYKALVDNNISVSQLCTSNKKKQYSELNSYRFLPNISVLLLPLRKGANGLNLIEATHVFLIEPLLNPGVELQAINRIHRIGQTQETTVHRFIVSNTIEEKIHIINLKRKQNQNKENTNTNNIDNHWKLCKSEKDCMTNSDLKELLEITNDNDEENNNNNNNIITIDNLNDDSIDKIPTSKYWKTNVLWEDNKEYPRYKILKKLQSKYFLDKLNTKNIRKEKCCNLYSITLPQSMAKKIIRLKEK